jgi:hypothetical protein
MVRHCNRAEKTGSDFLTDVVAKTLQEAPIWRNLPAWEA